LSYDFLMFKVTDAVGSPDDLADETTEIIGTGAAIRAQLSQLYPAITWTRIEQTRSIFGALDGPGAWYEFSLDEAAAKTFSIHTSHHMDERSLIPEICRALGLVAFDGQAYALIGL
jgi:hypothetical protein